VQALADCLEALRQGADLDRALQDYPEYRSQLRALLEVASLIQPLAEDVAPSLATREDIRARLLELRQGAHPRLFPTGSEPSEAF
jgi:hypothetical protein